jgi:Aerotolerance regulator N-terminal
MRFLALTPAASLALLAGVAAAVLLLYLLKPSPRRLTVASTLIWRRVLRERKRVPDRLRWWVSFLLAGAIALAIALALARPEVAAVSGRAQRVVLVLDNSTTLAASTSDGKARWEHAVERARELVRAGGAGSRYLVADTQRSIASPRYQDAAAALATIARLRVVPGGTPAYPSVVRPGAVDLRAVLVTDGVAALAPPPGVETVSVFQIADNAGITAFDVRALPGDPRRHQAYVEVLNASPGAKRIELQIGGAGGKPLVRTLDLAGGATLGETFDVSRFEGGPLLASIAMAYDALPLDDVAYSFLPAKRPIRVGLVTAGNAALERSLRLLPRTQLSVMTPARFSARSGIDVWVFDRYAPAQPPGAPALLFRPSRTGWLPATGGQLHDTVVSTWVRGHPVTDSLSLRDVLAERALVIQATATAQVLATDAGQRPLILASASGPRWVEVAFALEDSNLPLHAAFPVFLTNVLNWMTGEPLALEAGIGLVEIPLADAKVLDLQGEKMVTRSVPGATLASVEQPGFLTAIAPDRRVRVAVNVTDPSVTAINASRLAERPAAAPAPTSAGLVAASPWTLLLLLAALLLMLEWWAYNRRLTV